MRNITSRVLRVLKTAASRGRACLTAATIAGEARLSLSEVLEAIEELERKNIVVSSGGRVCLLVRGYYEEVGVLPSKVLDVLDKLSKRRSIIAFTGKVSTIPYVDYIVVKRDGTIFLIHIVRRGEHGEVLESIARKIAKQARRLAEGGGNIEGIPSNVKAKVIVPLLAADHGAPRLVEGVPFRPAEKLADTILDPTPLVSDPAVRIYYVRRAL